MSLAFGDMGTTVFSFKNFAENYSLFVHTMEERERCMSRKQKRESRALANCLPSTKAPTHPPIDCETV